MTDKHIRRCSTSLAAGQVKIETTRSYHVYQDAKDAHYETNPKAYTIVRRTVKKGDVLKLQQAPGGGFAVSLKKI